VVHDCIIVRPLSEMPVDSEEYMESDVETDDSDENELEDRMEELELGSRLD
jgi:hypothetical protein